MILALALTLWTGATAVSVAVCAIVLSDGAARRALHLAFFQRLAKIRPPSVAVIGDSLAAQCDWRTLGRRPFDVANLSAGGATIKEIAGQAVAARALRAKTLVVEGGLNDLLFDEATPEDMERDFRALFRRIEPDARAIVALMPHVADPAWAARIDAANRAIRALAQERGFAVVDASPRLSENGARRREMTDDGLHFSPLAAAIFVEAVREAAAGRPTPLAAPSARGR